MVSVPTPPAEFRLKWRGETISWTKITPTYISRVLNASESFIKATTVTFNLNLRGTSNNDILLFGGRPRRCYERGGETANGKWHYSSNISSSAFLKIGLHRVGCKSLSRFYGILGSPFFSPPVAAVPGRHFWQLYKGGVYDRVTA